jgi:cullin 3
MGTAELKAQFATKRHEMNVSTYQMCILLLFNNSNELSLKEILNATAIPINDLKRNLVALSCGKYKILLKDNNPKKIGDDDHFTFNSKFHSKLYRLKIVTVNSQKDNEMERQETRQKVDEDRKFQIEAAIVRIMKARKTMEHSNLISEVTKQLSPRFLPNPMLIKRRIESLIEKEYLDRSKTDRKVYNYLA